MGKSLRQANNANAALVITHRGLGLGGGLMSALEADKRAALQLRHLIGNNYRAWSQPAGCTLAAHSLTEYLVLIESQFFSKHRTSFHPLYVFATLFIYLKVKVKMVLLNVSHVVDERDAPCLFLLATDPCGE